MTIVYILAILFLALFIVIPLIEKSNLRMSDETTAKFSRWIWPLVMVLIIVQLIMFMF